MVNVGYLLVKSGVLCNTFGPTVTESSFLVDGLQEAVVSSRFLSSNCFATGFTIQFKNALEAKKGNVKFGSIHPLKWPREDFPIINGYQNVADMPPYTILPIDGMIPGPGYSSVLIVKYRVSVRLLIPNLNSYFSSL